METKDALNADRRAIIFLIALALLIFTPAVFAGRIFFDQFVYADFYPRLAWAARALAAGSLPLFAPEFAHGFPMFADHFGLIHPIVMLALRYLPMLTAYHLLVVAAFVFGSVVTYQCGRRVAGLTPLAAFLASTAYTYAGVNIFWGRELPWAMSIAIYPLLLLLARALGRRPFVWTFVGGLVVGFLLPVTYIEMVLYATLLAFSYVVFVQRSWTTAVAFAIMMLIAAAVSSPWLLPALAFIPFTNRAAGGIYLGGGDPAVFLGIGDLAQMFFPGLTLPFSPTPLLRFSTEGARLFFGVIPLPLAIFAALRRPRTRLTIFFLGAAGIAFVIMIPGSPFFHLLYSLPGLNLFRFAWKWLWVFVFSIAMLAGIGLDALRTNPDARSGLWRATKIAARTLLAAAILGWVALVLFRAPLRSAAQSLFRERFYIETLGRPIEHYEQVIDRALTTATRSAAPYRLAMLAGLIPLAVLAAGSRRPQLLVAATTLSVFLAAVGTTSYVQRSFLDEPPAVTFLKKQTGWFRVAPFVPYLSDYRATYGVDDTDPRTSADIANNILLGNWPLLYGLQNVMSSTSYMTARPMRLMVEIAGDQSIAPSARAAEFVEKLPLLQLMGVRYVTTSFPLPAPFREVFRAETSRGYPVLVYEVPDPLPRAYVAPRVFFLPEDEPRAFSAIRGETDFNKRTYVECANCRATTSAGSTLTLLRDEPLRMILRTTAPDDVWIVFSQAFLPHWQATIDGRPAEVFRANYLYQAVQVPAGTHHVDFSIRPMYDLSHKEAIE